jgi:hypothetical protein
VSIELFRHSSSFIRNDGVCTRFLNPLQRKCLFTSTQSKMKRKKSATYDIRYLKRFISALRSINLSPILFLISCQMEKSCYKLLLNCFTSIFIWFLCFQISSLSLLPPFTKFFLKEKAQRKEKWPSLEQCVSWIDFQNELELKIVQGSLKNKRTCMFLTRTQSIFGFELIFLVKLWLRLSSLQSFPSSHEACVSGEMNYSFTMDRRQFIFLFFLFVENFFRLDPLVGVEIDAN